MDQEKYRLRVLVLVGVALSALIFTKAMLTFVQAEGAATSIAISKEADQTVVYGSSASFTINVTNTGDVTLTNLTVLDELASNCSRPIGTLSDLPPGEGTRYECARASVTADFTNVALVTGTDLVSGTVVSSSDFAVVQVISPAIDIAKTAHPAVVNVGDTVDYTITVENTGDSDLVDVDVDDGLAGCDLSGPTGDDGGDLTLSSGETWTYVCSVTAGSGDIINTARVTATDQADGTVIGTAQANVDVIHPEIAVAKMAHPTVVSVGDTIDYTVTVENTGDSDLTGVEAEDGLAGCDLAGPAGDDGGDLTLALGETWAYTCSVTAGIGDIVNTARITATDQAGGTVTGVAQADVHVIHPAIEISKMPYTQTVAASYTANFTIAVANTGDVPLAAVTVSDVQARECEQTFAELLVAAHRSYTCTVAGVFDGFINSATVSGTASAGTEVTDSDAAKVRLEETQTCPAGMAAYWRLDETVGSSYDDFYYGHDGECTDQCPAPVPGYVNGGQAFDGYDTGIDVPILPGDDSFNWGVDDSFSIELWMKTDSGSAYPGSSGVIVGREDGETELHWWVGCRDGGQAAFYLRDRGGTLAGVIGATDLTDGSWHHVVASRDAGGNQIRLFVDGKLEDSSGTNYITGFESSTAALNIGWLNRSHGYHFQGVVDEVAVYDQALAAADVREHYNNGLVGRWYCQDGPFAPTIVSMPVTEATAGRLYVYDVEAAGNPAPTFTLPVKPTGMAIDAATGVISWTPSVAQEGFQDVKVRASNWVDAFTQSFTINVRQGTLCPDDMLAYWKLDETSVPTYYDFYDGYHGTCAGQCPAPAIGYVNGAQAFNGSSTGIDVLSGSGGAPFDWGVDDSFSIEFWMQTSSPTACSGGAEVMVGRDDRPASELHWWVGCADGGAPAFYLQDTGGTLAGGAGTETDLTDGAWHHVAAIRDASADQIRLFVDSTLEFSSTAVYDAGFDSLTAALNIGWLDRLGGYHFEGILDEVALYDRVLSTGEIEQHYNSLGAGPGYCINPDIAVKKMANPAAVYPGDPVTYTYVVTNTGDTPLLAVTPRDDKCGPLPPPEGDVGHDDQLDPDEAWVYYCSMNVSADITNTVSVTGRHTLDDVVSDIDTAFVDVIRPDIVIAKTADPTIIDLGETVTYTYAVSNPGDDPLRDVKYVRDDKCSPVKFVEGDANGDHVLDTDEAWIYTCSMSPTVSITNTATVTAVDSADGTWSAAGTAFVNVRDSTFPVFLPLVLRQ